MEKLTERQQDIAWSAYYAVYYLSPTSGSESEDDIFIYITLWCRDKAHRYHGADLEYCEKLLKDCIALYAGVMNRAWVEVPEDFISLHELIKRHGVDGCCVRRVVLRDEDRMDWKSEILKKH